MFINNILFNVETVIYGFVKEKGKDLLKLSLKVYEKCEFVYKRPEIVVNILLAILAFQTAAYGSVMKTCEGHVKISRIVYEILEFVYKR